MKYLYLFILSYFTINANSQDPSKNYIQSYVMLDQNASKYIETIQYFDGFGQPSITVQKGITPSRKNLLSEQWRDEVGRLIEDRLPIITTSDRIYSFKEAYATYDGDNQSYTEYSYDYSPLKRIISIGEPGGEFPKGLFTGHYSNTATGILSCKLYQILSTGEVATAGNYAAKELSVVNKEDENGNRTYIFTDKRGHEILVRKVLDNSTSCDTYFVYDSCDNLVLVLPPSYQDEPDLNLYAYQYKYDNWGHCIEKKLPGCQSIKYIYDQADNLIFSQDGAQREKLEWTFYLYDSFRRLTVKGICKNTNTSLASEDIVVCSLAKSGGEIVASGIENSGYSSSFELSSPAVHQINYYDDYSFISLPGFQNRSKFPVQTVAANGFLTGGITFVLNSNVKLYSATYYDIKGRPIRVTQEDHLGGHKITATTYTFTGKPLQVVSANQYLKKPTKAEIYKYTYDHADRLIKVTHQLAPNAPVVVLSENTYDELGRLSTKTYHRNDLLKSTYTYNIRNWLTGITGPKFTQKLLYNEKDGTNTSYYNGNISAMFWKSGDELLTRRYNFTYDGLDRLTKASYQQSDGLLDIYDVSYQYNKMGGITRLERIGLSALPNSFESIDNLELEYNGNQLKSVKDLSSGFDPLYSGAFNFEDGASKLQEYFYDANGNLIRDLNKNITSIQYNSLNLPSQIILHKSGYIDYQYSADGVKRRKESYTKLEEIVDPFPGFQSMDNSALVRAHYKGYTYTDYCSNFVYEDGELSKILTEEGYITLNGNMPVYHYYLRDHQGNNRVVVDQYGTVEEVNHYYPYGSLFGEGISTNKQAYKYGSKELDRIHGLNWYDFGKRSYDPVLGAWTTFDPASEDLYAWSPYVYCYAEPIKHVDPDGEFGIIGALVGGGMDYMIQVASNYATGNSNPWTDINKTSIAVSALSGAAGAGIFNALGKISKIANYAMKSHTAATITKVGKQVVSDAIVSAGGQYLQDGNVDMGKVGLDVISGQAGSMTGNKTKSMKQSSSEAKNLYRQADHDKRVARGNSPRESRIQRAKESMEKAQSYGDKSAEAAATAVSTGISKGVDKIVEK